MESTAPLDERPSLREPLGSLPGLARFADLYGDLTETAVREKIAATYTEDVVFYDTLKEIHGLASLTEYMLGTARNVSRCRVRIDDAVPGGQGVSRSEGTDLYVRWTMDVRFRRLAGGRSVVTKGMTHLRVAEDDRIAEHRDYWDPAEGFYEHVPMLGRVLRWIRSRV